MDSNLLVTTDTECTDGVAGFRGNGCLAGELFEDFGCTGETITRLADTDIWRVEGQYRVLRRETKTRGAH